MFINFIQIFILLSLGVVITLISTKIFVISTKRAIVLYIWHTFFSFFYSWYVINFGGDATLYYELALNSERNFGVSSAFVVYISSLFFEFAHLSYYSMGILFSIFGTIGLIAFDSSLKHVTKDAPEKIKLLATLIVFLPSASFWSSGIGKDSISFMAINLILFASINLNNRKLMLLFGIISLFLIRPHIAGIILIALALSMLINKNLKKFNRFILFSGLLIILIFALPFALNFVGFNENLTIQNLINFLEGRQNYNWKNWSGGIDISSMSLSGQIFTYLFRPLPFETHSVAALASSIENIFFIYLFTLGLIAKLKYKEFFAHPDLNSYFFLIYSVIALIILSMTTANIGISVRQKWMFLPFLIVLSISYIAQKKINN